MRHSIDPKIDCVFKALLGAEENRRLLVHFLNAMLGAELGRAITQAQILNPYNEREFLNDKLSVVDVKAQDELGRRYQIEIQLLGYPDLPARILYNWTDLYSQQLESGQGYDQLRPTYCIWLLAEALLRDSPAYRHCYRLRDDDGHELIAHGGIWLFELSKFAAEQIETEEQRWLKFFRDGERLDEAALPQWMDTAEMRQAMSTLKGFSEKERAYDAYQARQEYLREQRSLQRALEQARAELQAARQAEVSARQAEVSARQAEESARQAEDTARQAEESARQAEDTARQAEESARQAMQTSQEAMEAERQAKEEALAELARLRAKLGEGSGQSGEP